MMNHLNDLGGFCLFLFSGVFAWPYFITDVKVCWILPHAIMNVSPRIVEVEPCCWMAVEMDGVYAIPMILHLVPLVVQKKEQDDTLDLPPHLVGCQSPPG